MEKIASFTVDHTVLLPGMYLSRRDGTEKICHNKSPAFQVYHTIYYNA